MSGETEAALRQLNAALRAQLEAETARAEAQKARAQDAVSRYMEADARAREAERRLADLTGEGSAHEPAQFWWQSIDMHQINERAVEDRKARKVASDRLRVASTTGLSCAISGDPLEPGEKVSVLRGRWLAPVKLEHVKSHWFHSSPYETPCAQCERPLVVDSGGSGSYGMGDRRTLRFCSNKCREEHAVVRARKTRVPVSCQSCGETFEPLRSDAVFCSPRCRQTAHRRAMAIRADDAEVTDGAS